MLLFLQLAFLSLAAANSFADNSSLSRDKRQSQYICGSDPYRFHSDIPCDLYRLCPNGGFQINVGCTTDTQCQLYSQSSVCIGNCCCTRPRVVGGTTPQIFRDQGTGSVRLAWPLLITLSIWLLQ